MFPLTVLLETLAALALLGMSASTYAQGGPPAGTCSADARQRLGRVGDWADAQCAFVDPLFIAEASRDTPRSLTTSPCSETAEGLARVGGWTLTACTTVSRSAS